MLEASREDLVRAVDGLGEEEALAKPPSGWSAVDCVEHLVLTERAIRERIRAQAALAAGVPEGFDSAKAEFLLKVVPARRGRAVAPPHLAPSGRFASLADAAAAFQSERQTTLDYIRDTPDDLHLCGTEHFVFKMLDGHQWMVLLASHTTRHANQILELRDGSHQSPRNSTL